MPSTPSSPLALDPAEACASIEAFLRDALIRLRRRGFVLGLSGGVDSSVVAALCVRAVGAERVLGVFMPERDASPDALRLGREAARTAGVETTLVEDVGPALDALGCYARQREAIRTVFPDYGEGWSCKLVIPPLLAGERLNVSRLTVRPPGGEEQTERLTAAAYLALVAATNMKQRTRKLIEYTHADRLGYAVAGTPNRQEWALGFFVKNGDGAADVKPIAHLYKAQVYALAEHLGVPEEIRRRLPTTDTWSLPQTQEEFFFALPWRELDLCLWGFEQGRPVAEVAALASLAPEVVERVYRDVAAKRRAAGYLHARPLTAAGAPTPVLEGTPSPEHA